MKNHKQKRIRISSPWCGSLGRVTVDEGLAKLVQLIHKVGWITLMSCQKYETCYYKFWKDKTWLLMPARDKRDLHFLFPNDIKVWYKLHDHQDMFNLPDGEKIWNVLLYPKDIPQVERHLKMVIDNIWL